MNKNILSPLTKAKTTAERSWLLTQFNLEGLSSELREAVSAASVLRWFDELYLKAVLNKNSLKCFEELIKLSYIETFENRGYNIHERSRKLIQRRLWDEHPDYYRQLCVRATEYCEKQNLEDFEWVCEYICHLLITEPNKGSLELNNVCRKWENSPLFDYEKIEALAAAVRDVAFAALVSQDALCHCLFWEAKISYIRSNYLEALSKVEEIKKYEFSDEELKKNLFNLRHDILNQLYQLDQVSTNTVIDNVDRIQFEKQQLIVALQTRLIGNKDSIFYKELFEQKIPTFLNNYLQNSVQKIIHTEDPIQFNYSKRFNFEYKKIGLLKNELIKAFEEATIFTREELAEIISRTVQLQFDLIVQPGAALLNIFYRQRTNRIQSEIVKILDGLNDSRIYFKTLKKNIEEYDQYYIVEENFRQILNKTEKDVYQKNFIKAFLSDIYAYSNFLNSIFGVERSKINNHTLEILLSERKFKQYLPNSINSESNVFNIEGIASIFEKYFNRADPIDEDALKVIEDEIAELTTKSVTKTKSEIRIAKLVERYRAAEIEQSFGKEKDSEESDNRAHKKTGHKEIAISKKDRPKKFPKVTNSWKDPLDMIIERSKIEEQPEGPLISLKDLIDEKSERIIMKRIFCSDPHEYHEVIRKLESIDNWKDAKKLIDSELYVRSIEPFSREALMLGDLVFNRFFPSEH